MPSGVREETFVGEQFDEMRRAMVASQLRTTAIDDPRVIEAMARVPREDFVPADRRAVAYADLSVPLPGGRAMNTPMATGRLLDAAAIGPDETILIIGAATGYALAVAERLARRVIGVEVDGAMAARARERVPGALVVEGPLAAGASAHAPFDVIVIDGAVEQVPPALVDQLAPQGRLTTGLIDGNVTRLAIGRRGGAGFGLSSIADAAAIRLPGFARPREFAF